MANESILIIEDDDSLAEVLKTALKRAGYSVRRAAGGLGALCLPFEYRVDLILLDRRVAPADGRETPKRLKLGSRTYYIPVVLLIPKDEIAGVESVDLLGADGYIAVPTDLEGIVSKVRAVLEDREAHNRARELLLAGINADIEAIVDDTIRENLRDKTEEMVAQLSDGLVDLLEKTAREGLEEKSREIATDEFRRRVEEMVKESAATVVEEVANEIVTRISSDVVEDKSDAVMAKLEKDELPGLVKRVAEDVLKNLQPEIVSRVLEEAGKVLAQDIRENFPDRVKKYVAGCLPGLAGEQLPKLIGDKVEEAVKKSLESEIPKRIEKEALSAAREYAQEELKRYLIWALGISVAVLSAVTFALNKFL